MGFSDGTANVISEKHSAASQQKSAAQQHYVDFHTKSDCWPVKTLLQSYQFMLSGRKNQVCLPSGVKKRSARHHFPRWCDAAVQIRFHGNRVKVARACSSLWWQKGRFQEWVGSKEWRTATDYQKQLPCSWILPNFLPNILLLFKTQHNSLFVYIDPLLLPQCETRLCALLKKQRAMLFYFYSSKM